MKPAARRVEEREGRGDSHYQLELGSKSLLALFFGLAAVCGMFFAFGYTIGKHTIPATFRLGSSPTPSASTGLGVAPAAGAGVQPPNPQALSATEADQTPSTLSPAGGAATPGAGGTNAAAGTAAGASPAGAPATGAVPAPIAAPTSPPAAAGAPPGAAPTVPASPAGNSGVYQVQVFAGVQGDAQSLATALQSKGYPASVVAPAAGSSDPLYRVEVGPYLTSAEAQAMKSRLTADGYQAVVKQ
ncbi:MAG TPA: SPOR domain-containing protein [Terriglobales bacterium]|nr:SPOR domain-containing protein [Terriglobales bacterium]